MDLSDQRTVVPVVYVAAMFMSVLDTTVVTVALPTIGRELHGSTGAVALVSIAYLVALGVFIPVSGWLGDLLGGRRALLAAVGVFTAASVLCGLSVNLPELITFRFLQGIGGAVMTPVGLAMLFRVYPPAERVRIASVVTVFVTLGPALGPILGGVFTTYLTWRLAFFVNAPVGLAALLVGGLRLEPHRQPHPGRLDVAGLLLSGVGLGALLYGVSVGAQDGWTSPVVLGTVVAGVVLLAALVMVERRATRPLIDLRLFGNRLFTAATGLYALGSLAYLGTLFLVALFFQDALGMSAVQSGLTTFPAAVGTMVGAQLVTRQLYWRVGPRRLVVTGLLVIAAATALLGLAGTSAARWQLGLTMFVLGAGVSAVFVPSQAAAMATIDGASTGRASALFNAGKQVGAAIGVALLGSVLAALGPVRLQHVAAAADPDLHGYHVAFLVAAGIAVLAVGVALSIRDCDAAATMTRPARPGRRQDARTPAHDPRPTAATAGRRAHH